MPQPNRPLRILMLAPEPFFEPRGTPFSEYHRIKALIDLGHHVDLVTYPFGADVTLPNLRIWRSPGLPFVRRVPIGPSMTKVWLDVLLAWTAFRRLRSGSYDLIHSHEEAGVLGVWLSRRAGIPHLYDMHSSLPQQLTNFRYARGRLMRRLFETIERRAVFGSQVVITICQELQNLVAGLGAGGRAVLIENVMGGDVEEPPSLSAETVRPRWGIGPDQPLILYAGTFEPYQGLELLRDAAVILAASHPSARVLVVGGEPPQVESARARARTAGAPMIFTGRQPAADIPAYIAACDILVSPRTSGTNTPLKIYSYLRSGKPIVATDLVTHTQVLDASTAMLVAPEPAPFAAALARLIEDPALARRLADAARSVAGARYSRDSYLARIREAYARLWNANGDEDRRL